MCHFVQSGKVRANHAIIGFYQKAPHFFNTLNDNFDLKCIIEIDLHRNILKRFLVKVGMNLVVIIS